MRAATTTAAGPVGRRCRVARSRPRKTIHSHTKWRGCRGPLSTQSFTYNADDTIASSTTPAGTTASDYNAVGDTKTDGCVDYSYDGFDRNTKTTPKAGRPASCGQSVETSYTYDGLDRQRTRTETGSPTTDLTYDGRSDRVTAETTSSVDTTWVIDPTGDQKAITKRTATPTTGYLTDDGQGNITTVTGTATGTGAVQCTVRLDPFGTPENPASASNPCNTGSTDNDAFYRGARRDKTTGTYQFGSRTYDPAKASFLTPDSYRAADAAKDLSVNVDPLTRNRYSYVNGDPINFVDPSGHEPRMASNGQWVTPPSRELGINSPAFRAMWNKMTLAQKKQWIRRNDPSIRNMKLSNAWDAKALATSAGKGLVNGLRGEADGVIAFATLGHGPSIGAYYTDPNSMAAYNIGKAGGLAAATVGTAGLGQMATAARTAEAAPLVARAVGAAVQGSIGFWSATAANNKSSISSRLAVTAVAAVGGAWANGGATSTANSGPDFVAGPIGSEPPVPVSQSRMAAGFDEAGFPSTPTASPGVEYTLPDGTKVRLMEPSGQAPMRASFTNANGGPINPFTGKPVQPPAPTGWTMKDWVRALTHVEQTP